MIRFTPAERMLVARYLWPGAGGRLVLLVAAIGCAGVAIGVASLVLVVSFMNGAEARLATGIASVDGHLTISRPGQRMADWPRLRGIAAATPGVAAAVPVLARPGMVTVAGRVAPADLQGMAPADIDRSPAFADGGMLIAGTAPRREGDVAIGSDLASKLGVMPGEPLAITTASVGADGGLVVDNHGARVAGIVHTESYAFDARRVVLPIEHLRTIARSAGEVSRIDVTLADPDRLETAATTLRRRLGSGVDVRTWRAMNARLFAALAQEKVAMGIVTAIVTVVALFNILSSMVLLGRSKAREIAILRTMGASRWSVAKVFVAVGGAIGLTGELAGLGLGFGLRAMKDPVTAWAGAHLAPNSPELAVLLDLPLIISGGEVAWITAWVALGVLASALYPAMRAAAVDPVAVLRYD